MIQRYIQSASSGAIKPSLYVKRPAKIEKMMKGVPNNPNESTKSNLYRKVMTPTVNIVPIPPLAKASPTSSRATQSNAVVNEPKMWKKSGDKEISQSPLYKAIAKPLRIPKDMHVNAHNPAVELQSKSTSTAKPTNHQVPVSMKNVVQLMENAAKTHNYNKILECYLFAK